ncbi:MAG TPA: adenylate/guanylate cyclase domain-containing protein [Myxococcota bacterium]|nr:adenylate/guanylate cyclase domain-containing protein [Myxococcota bacterium]
MSQVCPKCGEPDLPQRSRFCLSCGAPCDLPQEPHDQGAGQGPYTPAHLTREVLKSQGALEGERKEVTVLIADVVRSLEMAEALDPEDVHSVMDGFFELAVEAVHAQCGTLNQFRGDGFMALFGAPRAQGEDAVRALRAALEVRARTKTYSERIQERFRLPLALRMGVHTGTVWVGSIGTDLRMDYTAEGPTVGLAARLEQAAAPDEILISEETARRAGQYFDLIDLGPRALRGLRDPVRVYRLAGPGRFETRMDAERSRGLTPFVGRRNELIRLVDAEVRAAAGRTVLVEIRGEAGLGKSRLVLEHRAGESAGLQCLELGCRETNAKRAFAPVLDCLERWPEGLPDPGEAARLGGILANPSAHPMVQRAEVIDALHALFVRAARSTRLLLAVEDLQWMDPSTRLWLDALLTRTPSAPLLVLATSRPEHESRWPEGAQMESIELAPLETSEAQALAHHIVTGLPDENTFVALAVQRGGGNPLFVEEVSRSLRDGSEELRRSARLEMALRGAAVRVPETLQGVIAARVDALQDQEKRLLEAMSVLGLPVGLDLLREIEPAAQGHAARMLEDLCARGLLCVDRTEAYDFRHGLVREVAYGQILRSRRRGLHRSCAEALASLPDSKSPALSSRVGTHYDLAGEAARALPYLLRAGEAYLRLHAGIEATAHLQRAWELVQDGCVEDAATRATVGLSLVSAFNLVDRSGEAAAVLESLQGQGLEESDRLRLGSAYIEGGWISYTSRNQFERAVTLVEHGVALVENISEGRAIEGRGHVYLLRLYQLDGEVSRSLSAARRLLEIATAAGDRCGRAYALANLAATYCDRGEIELAAQTMEDALALAQESENELTIGMCLGLQAKVWVFRGDAERALAAADLACQSSERAGQVGGQYIAAAWRGHAYLLRDEPAKAAAEFDRLAVLNPSWPSTFDQRARGRLELGRAAEAVELARACLALHPPRLIRARALCSLGRAIAASQPGAADQAEAALGEAVSLCDALGLRPQLAEAHLALFEVCALRGDRDRAIYFAKRAERGFESCGMRVQARRVAEQAARLADPSDLSRGLGDTPPKNERNSV